MAKFKTRARTVDMLGRQQIAGIPTAISELFKNAHDAYANEAVVDFFRSDRLLVLRDDGIGMTESDYEDRWLVLGTESKASLGGSLQPPPQRLGYSARAVLGEKGIGRLAIAVVGPQVLMLSRPVRGKELGDLLVSFCHWGMFELPGVNLDQVEVPTVTLRGGSMPSDDDIRTLVGWASENFESLAADDSSPKAMEIRNDLAGFAEINLSELLPVLGSPDLISGPGTHFYIRPASPLFGEELDEPLGRPSDLRRMLVGFANTMTPGHASPNLSTSFRDHYTEDAWRDVIEEANFFTVEDFLTADHHISGQFDEHGTFHGTVAVYQNQPEAYKVPWTRARGRVIGCGPFTLNLAYVQGRAADSVLSPQAFALMSAKLQNYGGLYIYRDSVRVLPYGNSDFDFLGIEERRAKSASDAFFSYRRMLGVIELTRRDNANLREKAGREGFADNDSYRQFRAVLSNFFQQVAVDYFRDSGAHADPYWSKRAELSRLDAARKRRARQVRVRRAEFATGLDLFFARVDEDAPRREVEQLLEAADADIALAISARDPSNAAQNLLSVEEAMRVRLDALANSYSVGKPRGIGLTQAQTKAWYSYENERARLMEEVFRPAELGIQGRVSLAASKSDVAVDRRVRFDSALDSAIRRATDQVGAVRRSLTRATKETNERVSALGRSSGSAMASTGRTQLVKAAAIEVEALADTDFVRARGELEDEIRDTADRVTRELSSVLDQLEHLSWPSADGGEQQTSPLADEIEAIETDLEALRQRSEEDLELVQLGMAIEIINHEFENTVTGIRRNLRRIKTWADNNRALMGPYNELRAGFEHLDRYLSLFTPLHRRLYGSPVPISGAEIEHFVRSVFETRLADQLISLTASAAFRTTTVVQEPALIYPVFVNLIDNAIYWLSDYRGKREIRLDMEDAEMVISDTGPGVSDRDRESIFDARFSRKPGGSGYGLFISRELMGRAGWTLYLAQPTGSRGAAFHLVPRSGPDENE